MRDEESISAANEHGISMVFTGFRHFKHWVKHLLLMFYFKYLDNELNLS
jgi:hypothetical protein